jgi:hypothetical protein
MATIKKVTSYTMSIKKIAELKGRAKTSKDNK